jgi:hypothetical protein
MRGGNASFFQRKQREQNGTKKNTCLFFAGHIRDQGQSSLLALPRFNLATVVPDARQAGGQLTRRSPHRRSMSRALP